MKVLRAYSFLFLLSLCVPLAAETEKELKAETLYLQGLEFYCRGDVSNAAVLFEESLRLNPGNDAVHYYIACIAAAANDVPKALAGFEKAHALDTANVWYAMQLARLYTLVGKYDRADTLYSALGRRKSGDPELLSSLAELRLRESRFEDADSLLTRIERISGPSDYVDLTRIELLRQKGDFSGLFRSLDEFFSRESTPAGVKKDILERMLKGSDPRFNYMHIQDYDRLFNTCLRVNPSDTALAHLAGDFLLASGKPEKVKELCKKYPFDTHMLTIQAYTQFNSGDYEGTIESCERLIELAGDDRKTVLEAMTMRADGMWGLKEYDRAFREYDKILKMNRDNMVVLNNYAYYLSVLGRKLGKAAAMSSRTVAAEPENATYLDTYGWIQYKRKNYRKAQVIFRKAMIYGGKDNPEVLRHYAAVLDALGETALAEGYRQQAEIKENGNSK